VTDLKIISEDLTRRLWLMGVPGAMLETIHTNSMKMEKPMAMLKKAQQKAY
jgi:hypothetical protein